MKKYPQSVYESIKTDIDVTNIAEVITAVLLAHVKVPFNFDAVYGMVSFYVASADFVTLEGLKATIKMAADLGKEYDSNIIYDTDWFC